MLPLIEDSYPRLLDVTIRIIITRGYDRTGQQMMYRVSDSQAEVLRIGPPPPDILSSEYYQWINARERADAFAKVIGLDVAHCLMKAFNPSLFPETKDADRNR